MVFMFGVFKVFPQLFVFKIHIRHPGRILLRLWIITAIGVAASSEPFKLHYVLSKCASFV